LNVLFFGFFAIEGGLDELCSHLGPNPAVFTMALSSTNVTRKSDAGLGI